MLTQVKIPKGNGEPDILSNVLPQMRELHPEWQHEEPRRPTAPSKTTVNWWNKK